MHELFLTAVVSSIEARRAAQHLQGYCEMTPISIVRRIVTFKGPLGRNQGFAPGFIAAQGPKAPLWKALHEQLIRNSYLINLEYDMTKEQFPNAETAHNETPVVDCNSLPGLLQWYEVPEPSGLRSVNSRHSIPIPDEKNLCTTLQSINYRFDSERIQAGWISVHENVTFTLSHYLEVPRDSQLDDQGKPALKTYLPVFDDLSPYDSEDKWILRASVQVFNGNDKNMMKLGTEELMNVKQVFEDLYTFHFMDRLVFDTRVKD